MREIGAVVRLQIQRSSLKTGEKPQRVYGPSPVVSVRRLAVGGDGVLGEGEDRSWLVDVHHRAHPQTKNPDGLHGVSVGFTSHYDAMRQRFSDRITLGCAGENIIVETSRRCTLRSEEHTSELQSPCNLVCRLLLEKKKTITSSTTRRTPLQPHYV